MIRELDVVILKRDIEEHSLRKGMHGTVVHCYDAPGVYEVEFFDESGRTITVATTYESDIELSMPRPDPVRP